MVPKTSNTYTKFTYNRLDLSFSIPKVISRSALYQPMQKILILAAANYLQICYFSAKTCKLICQGLSLCSHSHVSGTFYMCKILSANSRFLSVVWNFCGIYYQYVTILVLFMNKDESISFCGINTTEQNFHRIA